MSISSASEEENSQKSERVKRKSPYHNLRKYIREYSEVTGIHGLRYITEKRSRTEKIIWIIIFIISLGGCVYMIYEIVKKFENSPVVVSFATKDTPIYEMPFPAVTICPEAKCSQSKFNYTDIYVRYLRNNSTVDENDLRIFHYMSILCDDGTHEKLVSTGNKTFNEDFFLTIDELKKPMDEMLQCYSLINGRNTLDNCQDILTPIITDEGICYSYNILDRNKIYKNHVVHYSDYHRVIKDSEDYDGQFGYKDGAAVNVYPTRALLSGGDNAMNVVFIQTRLDNDIACSKFLQGFKVLVHSPNDIPQLSKHLFLIPLNKVVAAAVEPKLIKTSETVKKFKPEKRGCYLQNERTLQHFKIYSQANCMLECVTNYTLNQCGCVGFYMPRDNGTNICGTANTQCMKKARDDLNIKELEKKISGRFENDETHCDCKPSCTDVKYNVETSHSDFYWKEYFLVTGELDGLVPYQEKLDFSVLSIYLKAEQITTLERDELYGVSDLISNFGGLLGLFTGFSLISCAELIYFLTLRIFYNDRLYGSWSGPSD